MGELFNEEKRIAMVLQSNYLKHLQADDVSRFVRRWSFMNKHFPTEHVHVVRSDLVLYQAVALFQNRDSLICQIKVERRPGIDDKGERNILAGLESKRHSHNKSMMTKASLMLNILRLDWRI